jgi:hypothetical protein
MDVAFATGRSYNAQGPHSRGDWILVRLAICIAASFGVLAAAAGLSTARAQEPDCRFFKIATDTLNLFKEPRGASEFVIRLDKNDIVCIGREQKVGDLVWAYIVYKLEKQNQRKAIEGWGIMRALEPATPAELAAARGPLERPPPPAVPVPAQDVVRFSEPIPFGPFPVNGHSLEELIAGLPTFPPFEGMEESLWKKRCSSCHQWDRQSLCAQAATYVKNPKAALRIPHPYGGPEKTAMMKWAQGGCQ